MEIPQSVYALVSVFSFVLGSVVGSFLNVCVHRLPRGESVVSPRSRCPKCESGIAWYDNIPLLSWLFLGAKCRNCGTSISWQYPLVEGLTGLLFFLVFWRFGFTVASPVYMLLAAALVLVTFIDLTDWTIPEQVTLPGILAGILCAVVATWYPESGLRVLGAPIPVFSSLIGAAAGGLGIYLLDKAAQLVWKKPGMGLGDVMLMAMLGAFFGWAGVVLILVIASIAGSVIGLITIQVVKGRETDQAEAARVEDGEEITLEHHYLPFGPYLCLAALVVMFFGREIVDFYMAWMDVGP
jgi:leader peptidase (prepilin peptidase)/N-methyltransferase